MRLTLHAFSKNTKSIVHEPITTPSILATIPECLRNTLQKSISKTQKRRKSVLISSNSLANRFILSRWGIHPSQRRHYRNLFAAVRKHCRAVFRHTLAQGRLEWESASERYVFGVYKFDEIRGNLILGFMTVSPNSEWFLKPRSSTWYPKT